MKYNVLPDVKLTKNVHVHLCTQAYTFTDMFHLVIGSHPSPYLTSVFTACSPWSHLSLLFLSLALSGKLLAASCSELETDIIYSVVVTPAKDSVLQLNLISF